MKNRTDEEETPLTLQSREIIRRKKKKKKKKKEKTHSGYGNGKRVSGDGNLRTAAWKRIWGKGKLGGGRVETVEVLSKRKIRFLKVNKK